jgi:hypothetical protein
MTKTAVKLQTRKPTRKPKRRVCKHPGRFLNRCKNCPRRG